MTLQRRISTAVGGTLAITMATLFIAGISLMSIGMTRIERNHARQDLDRSSSAFAFAGDDLATKLGDWSNWDDCHRFVIDRNPEFIKSNLQPESLDLLKIDAILILDAQGAPIVCLARGHDSLAVEQSFPGLAALVNTRDTFFSHQSIESIKSGLIDLPEGLFIGASRSILDSTSNGPARGVIAFLTRVDAAFTEEVGRRLRAHLELHPLHSGGIPPAELEVAEELLTARGGWSFRTDREHSYARTILCDLQDRPVAILTHRGDRDVHQHGARSLAYFLAALTIAGITSIIATILTVRRIVVSRVQRLHSQISRIQESGTPQSRVICDGEDEIRELGEAMNCLLDANEQAQNDVQGASRAKSDFVASISHEIRTPMTAILGYADLLACEHEHGLDATRRAESLSAIQRNGEHLLALLNDVLDISKIEAGCMKVEAVPCDPAVLVGDVHAVLSGKAAASGVELRMLNPGMMPTFVVSDPLRLRQILLNLTSNAIKFSPGGRVSVQITHQLLPRPRLRFEVADTGIGMTQLQQATLFSDFSQADHSIARRFGGTGLGLSISRKLARMLGGDIDVKSEPGRGSTFTVLVDAPLAPGATMRQPGTSVAAIAPIKDAAKPAPASGELNGQTILLAEDNADSQRLLAFHLKRAGASVMIVGNGRDAVTAFLTARASGHCFDLVLMDMQMPELDGFEATRQLRSAGVTTPIVALTAHALAEDRQRCLEAGCDEHAPKPIERNRLIATCARLVGSKHALTGITE